MFIILFGVTGSGKTTIGQLLASQLNWPFYDADDFHPATNIEKLRWGVPLTDQDRQPWLESLYYLIASSRQEGKPGVMACSALKNAYREYLHVGDQMQYVYLRGEYALIKRRLESRVGHFMNPALLRNQFDTIEEPYQDELIVSVDQSPSAVVQEIRRKLQI